MDRLIKQALPQLPPQPFVDRLSDIAFICSRDASRLEYLNAAAVELIGATQAQLAASQPWWNRMFDEASQPILQAFLMEISQGSNSRTAETLMLGCRSLGGTTVSIEVHSAFHTADSVLVLARSSLTSGDAEKILRQTRARFRSIIDSLSINLILKDIDRRRIYANRAFLDLRGFELADIVGKRDEDLYSPDLAEQFTRDDEYVLATGKVIHKFEENVGRGGKRTWMEMIKGPLLDADHNINGVQILFWDATDRKQTEEALKQERSLLHALLEKGPDSIYFKDRESRFVRISRGMAEKFNLASPDIAIGKTDADIFTAEHAQQARQDELRIMETGEPIVNLVERETWPDRADSWCSSSKMPLYDSDGKVVGTFGISRDISDLIAAEQQLREARDQANQASRAKSEFLANMSHEIRTPMNGILGMAELLSHTQLTDVQRSSLTMIQQSAESLLRIINDILDFSKIEAGKLDIESVPFDLRKSVGQAAKGLAIRAAKNGVELLLEIAPDVPDYLRGDADRLRQVIVNLVGNAIKFTAQGSITISIKVADGPPAEADYTLHFAIRDTGIGIPRNKQKAIFDAFAQADVSTTRQYGGTGLGLSISSQLVGMMGGSIWLESEVGVGSTFHFSCRMPPAKAPASDREEESELALRAIPMLLVDDRDARRQALAAALERRGFNVRQAADARQAEKLHAEILQQYTQRPTIIIDQGLEKHDGLALMQQLVSASADRQPVAILLSSASQMIGDEARDLVAGVTVLQKPVLHSEICNAIRDSLSQTTGKPTDSGEPKAARTACPLHLLVAEDGEVNRAVLVGLLERVGHEVASAQDGEAALEAWENFEFDAIFMDVQMPKIDGLEATRRIRQQERHTPGRQRIPIIAITAAAMARDYEDCLAAGMDDYLSKPIDFASLAELLDRLQQHLDCEDRSKPLSRAQAKKSARQDSQLQSAKSVNFDAPLRKLNYTPEQQHILVQTMQKEAKQRLEQLTESIETHDTKLLIRAAHSLASAAALFEVKNVREAAATVEAAARAGDVATAEANFGKLRDSTANMIQEIRDWLAARESNT